MQIEEEWRDVVGYESYFKVSSLGRVFSKRTDKILKLYTNDSGYLVYSAKIGGRKGIYVNLRVHSLVAKAFIDNPDNKPYINHLNGNKTDNNVNNLEWCTHKENMIHAFHNNLINVSKGEDHILSKLTENDILFIQANARQKGGNMTQREIASALGVKHAIIGKILRGEAWKHLHTT